MTAENELDYSVKLENQMSGPAQEAGKSLSSLALELIETKKAVALFQQQASLSKQVGDAGAYTKYTALLGEQKTKLLGLSEAVGGVSKAQQIMRDEQKQQADWGEKFAKQSEAADAALASFMTTYAAAVGVIAAGVVTIGYAAVKLGEFAIEATQSKQAMVSMLEAMGGAGEGVRLESMLSDLSEQIGITKDALAPLTASFQAMGIEGEAALRKVTLAAASARALMQGTGKDGAAAFEALTRKIQVAAQTGQGLKIPAKGLGSLAEMGLRVDEVAKRMNVSSKTLAQQLKNGTVNAQNFGDALQSAIIDKGEKPLARLSLAMKSMKGIFEQSIGDLFEDLEKDADPFLLQMKDLLGLFSQTSFIGQAMKSGVGGGMKLFFQLAQQATREFEIFFLKVIEDSARTYVFLKKHWGAVKFELLGVAIAIGVVAAALTVSAALLVGPFVLAAAAVGDLVFEIGHLYEEGAQLYGAAVQWGSDTAKGFADGIANFAAYAKEKAVGMAKGAWEGAKNFLGIHSPSRVMMSLGKYTGMGFAAGIGQSKETVVAATETMGDAAIGGAARGTRAADFPSQSREPAMPMMMQGAGKGMSVGDVTVNITAPNGVTDATRLTEIGLATLLERLVLQQGV